MDVAVSIDAEDFTGWSQAVDVNPDGRDNQPPIYYVISNDGALGFYGTAEAIIDLAAQLAQTMYSQKLALYSEVIDGTGQQDGQSSLNGEGQSGNGSGNTQV